MAQTTETATILPLFHNNANYTMTQSSWSFLSNNTSPTSDGNLNFRGICCIIVGLAAIGCEAPIMSQLGRE